MDPSRDHHEPLMRPYIGFEQDFIREVPEARSHSQSSMADDDDEPAPMSMGMGRAKAREKASVVAAVSILTHWSLGNLNDILGT